ncbi:MAG: DUF5103 domain-containing protein [Ignavibacterium sp.]|nr:DUF5103 domain-containing protein [Ignavibacterium sp.]MCX7611797.1 DUF5103 domain-containing protein [Ignavibacterium sp.]MDW8374390.1 DUF5103 domain-containing protein [Ignavibacteriales bacterium]
MIKLFFTWLLIITNSFSQISIRSLHVYTTDDNRSFPVVNSSNKLVIDFDVDSKNVPDLNIIFKFCDKNWNPTDNIFLQNQGQNTAYILNYFSLPVNVEEARFHFSNRFPDGDGYVSFPYSGKWKFFIVNSKNPDVILAEGKFIVDLSEIPLDVNIKKSNLMDKIYSPNELSRSFEIIINATIPENLFPNFVEEVEIFKDHLIDFSLKQNRNNGINLNRDFKWDGASKLSFVFRDLRPGNGYRQVNLMNTNLYSGKNVFAQFEGYETTRFYSSPSIDFNGGMQLKNPRDPYANYMNVKFRLKPANEIHNDIYLIGAFNNWKISDEYKLDFDGDLFTKTILLKRGIYDYQYAVVENNSVDLYSLEGNNYNNTTTINILMFYRDPQFGGYDRMIGFSRIHLK